MTRMDNIAKANPVGFYLACKSDPSVLDDDSSDRRYAEQHKDHEPGQCPECDAGQVCCPICHAPSRFGDMVPLSTEHVCLDCGNDAEASAEELRMLADYENESEDAIHDWRMGHERHQEDDNA